MGEVSEPALELLGAGRGRIRAAIVDLVRISDDGCAAVGTMRGEDERDFRPVACIVFDPHHLGNDLAGFLDDHGVAHADVLAGDLVGIVQGRSLHGRAGQPNRSQVGHGRQLARLTDLNADARDLGDRLLGLVLECDGPARALAPRSQPLALAQVVNLDHQAVGLKIERVPLLFPVLGVGDDLLNRSRNTVVCGLTGTPHSFSMRVILK